MRMSADIPGRVRIGRYRLSSHLTLEYAALGFEITCVVIDIITYISDKLQAYTLFPNNATTKGKVTFTFIIKQSLQFALKSVLLSQD